MPIHKIEFKACGIWCIFFIKLLRKILKVLISIALIRVHRYMSSLYYELVGKVHKKFNTCIEVMGYYLLINFRIYWYIHTHYHLFIGKRLSVK